VTRALRAALPLLLAAAAVLAPTLPTAADPAPPVEVVRVHVPDTPAGFATAGYATAAPADTPAFAMVALEVDGEAPVQVRTALGDGPWSAWRDVPHQHGDGPDPRSPEARSARPGHRTSPVFTGPADRLQVRTAGARQAAVAAWLVDPLGLDRPLLQRAGDALAAAWRGTPPAAAEAQAGQPAIVTRAGWGADESIVGGPPAYARSVDRAFVHHTAGDNAYTPAQAPAVVRGVQAFHVHANGWSDIGYNLLVDRFGTVYEGRAGGIGRPVIGAQAAGFNTGSTGIALLGTFGDEAPPAAALDALVAVLAWTADHHHVDPLGRSTAVSAGSARYAPGTAVDLDAISGHRAVQLTACPGDAVDVLLPGLRQRVRAAAGALITGHRSDVLSTRVVRGDPDADAIRFTARLDPPGAWRVQVRAPDGRVVHTAEGDGVEVDSTLQLVGGGWALGAYAWEVTAPGRTAAAERVDLEPPVVEGLAVPARAVANADGVLLQPVVVEARLWPGATWRLRITDPRGRVVHADEGTGDAVRSTWVVGAATPGRHRVEVTADDAEPGVADVDVAVEALDRLAGEDDPVAAAVALSRAAFPDGGAARAVLARHDVFADALAGGPLAGGGGPLLLTAPDRLDPRVAAELDRVLAPGATVHVLGGQDAVAPAVLDAVEAAGAVAERVAGATRIATAAAVAELVLDRSGATTAMVARAGPDGASPWADALAGGAWGAAAGVPVLLSERDALSPETAEAVRRLGIRDAVVLGGTAALSDSVAAALPRAVRVAGEDRAGTAAAVATRLWGSDRDRDELVLANGIAPDAWAWALAAAPLAAVRRAPLLLTTATALPPATAAWLDAARPAGGVAVGPGRLVDPEVVVQVGAHVG
jgi:putative cell wall-binding protein